MLVLVTVQAEELPVAAIRRIVVVIVIPMMHGQLANAPAAEIATALGAHMRKQFQGTGAIAPSDLGARSPRVSYELVQLVVSSGLIRHGQIRHIDITLKQPARARCHVSEVLHQNSPRQHPSSITRSQA